MEGKGVLFKRFADIDVFDIEIDSNDPDEIIRVPAARADFGGINLEDIKAPECFYIEEAQEDDGHPGLSRRPARHGHHFRRRAAQRRRDRR
jgi:malic enzyme